jgi:CRP-like cAMP-binding protein
LLEVLGPGQAFGELAPLAPGDRRQATVVMLEPVETLVLGTDRFTALVADHPSVDEVLIAVPGARVRDLSRLLQDARYLPARQRVLRRLTELADLCGGEGRPIP